jgi:hypothetical protein
MQSQSSAGFLSHSRVLLRLGLPTDDAGSSASNVTSSSSLSLISNVRVGTVSNLLRNWLQT